MSTPDSEAAQGKPDLAGKLFTGFLLAAVCLLSVLVVLLVRQNRDLRAQLDWKKRVEATTATRALAIGESVEPLELIGIDSSVSQTAFGENQPATLVFFVSEHCGYCEKAIPLWTAALRETRETLASAKGSGVRIVGIVADALDDASLKQIAPEIPTFRVRDGHKTWLIRVNATPSAVLLSPMGKVENFWIGETNSAQVEELRTAILAAAAH
ncbi:MAG: thioredoxin family protein [Planctomycetes bacterium]|nr:thioredoxin family protein [Planctomycetota bacterium]